MSKPLLVEYMQFNPIGSINETNGDKFGVPGGYIVQGKKSKWPRISKSYFNEGVSTIPTRVYKPE